MKISFVCTILNETHTIEALLHSLENQSQKPDEVIIVDGGSTDGTVTKINYFHARSSLNIRLFRKKGNRSRGRNLGIGEAKGEGIAVSDAGCLLNKDWLKRITKPLRQKRADAVAGWYTMNTPTIFTHCSAPFFGPMSHNINKHTFLPASRSIAFTKETWAKVGGYPTDLAIAAEDIVFAQKLFDDPTIKMVKVLNATVEWTPPQNVTDFFHAIKNHTRGNIQAGYTRHLKKNALVAIRYTIGVSLLFAAIVSANPYIWMLVLLLVGVYLLYPSVKHAPIIRSPADIPLLGLLQLTADLAVISALFHRNRK